VGAGGGLGVRRRSGNSIRAKGGDYDEPYDEGPLRITISVELMDAGDFYPTPGLLSNPVADTGNDFVCMVEYTILTNETIG